MPRKKTEAAAPVIAAPNGVSFTMYCQLADKEELTALARELNGSRADALRYALSVVREKKGKKSLLPP